MKARLNPKFVAFVDRSRFSILFITLITLIFISPYLIHYKLGFFFLGVIMFFVMLSIVFTMLEDKRIFLFSCGVAMIVLTVYWVYLFYESNWLRYTELILSTGFYIFAIYIIFKEIIRAEIITMEIIFAALSVYLLIAVVYSGLYNLIVLTTPESFACSSPLGGESCTSQFNLIYFSFTTLTTVGFGDIVPITREAKAVVILEEITGVFYTAAIISRLVSSLSRQKK